MSIVKFIVVLVVIGTHLSYIGNGFVWLDHGDIERGRAVLPLNQLYKSFITGFGETGYYRPVVTILHSIDKALFGKWAPGYHLTNVALHLGVGVAAGVFLKKFFGLSGGEALVATLVVGIHPVNWFTVGTVSNRQELLVVLFTLLAFLRVEKGFWFAALAFLALLSKETALFWVPAIFLLLSRTNFGQVKYLVISLAAYAVLRVNAVPEVWRTRFYPLDLSQAIGTRFLAGGRLFYELISPINPAVSDATKIINALSWMSVAGAALVLILVVFMVRNGIRSYVGKGIALLLISVLPAFNLVPLPRFSALHYGYLAVVPLSLIVVIVARRFKYLYLFWGIWMAIAGVSTFRAGFTLKDDRTLFENEVRRDPNFLEGYFYLGNYHFGKGDWQKAEEFYQRAGSPSLNFIAFVDKTALLINLAGAKLGLGKLDEAEDILLGLRDDSVVDKGQVVYNLASISEKRGDYYEVIERLESYNGSWNRPEPILLLMRAYIETKQIDKAKQLVGVKEWEFTGKP